MGFCYMIIYTKASKYYDYNEIWLRFWFPWPLSKNPRDLPSIFWFQFIYNVRYKVWKQKIYLLTYNSDKKGSFYNSINQFCMHCEKYAYAQRLLNAA